jgi:hypothetical protein
VVKPGARVSTAPDRGTLPTSASNADLNGVDLNVTERIASGRLTVSIPDVLDGVDLLPDFQLAALAVLDGNERPGEWPTIRRRLRAEGIRHLTHRGAVLLTPGELDRLSSVGMLGGQDELYLVAEWNDEFEVFPGRITTDLVDFDETTPLGLEEWMIDAGCLLALGEGQGLNFATLDSQLAERLRTRFPVSKARR